MSLPTPSQVLADVQSFFTSEQQAFMNFVQKVKTGAEVLATDIDEVVNAVNSSVATLNSQMQTVETWVEDILPLAQALGLPASDAAAVTAALTGAKALVTSIESVQSEITTAAPTVTSALSAIAAVSQAQSATSTVIAAVASVPSPNQTQAVSS